MAIWEMVRNRIPIQEQNLRVCYYARVSTDHELQATSIMNQMDYFEKYIKEVAKWTFVKGYVDEGISGKEVRKREQFLRMIEDSKAGKFDLILTKSVSRFARNTVDSIQYTELLLQYGVGVFFLNDNINTFYSDSEFRLTLMASIAQDELRKLSESVQFGLSQSIKRGVVLGNSNILGYVKERGKLVIVPEEARIVRDIFAWFVTGRYGYREVASKVFEKYNKILDGTGIRRILMNCKYKGYYCGGKSRVIDYKTSKRKEVSKDCWVVYPSYESVPPIVKEEVWDRVQEIILLRSRKKVGKWKIFCGTHKREFLYKRKKYKDKVYEYYVCPRCCSFSGSFIERMYLCSHFQEMVFWKKEEDFFVCVK